MNCKGCPHLVRHGQMAKDNKTLEFRNMCGLTLKTSAKKECHHLPFHKNFDYMDCETYIYTFKTAIRKNDVMPTQDFQYSDYFTGTSITDMELL